MNIMSWFDRLQVLELDIGKIIAVAVSDEPYYDYSENRIYNQYFETNLDGIDSIRNKAIFAILTHKFDSGYGSPEGYPFTAWTNDYVIFPTEYDGSEDINWVPRHPCAVATKHI